MPTTTPPLDFGPRFEVAWRSLVSPQGNVGRENQDNYLVVDGHGRAESLKGQLPHRFDIPNWPAGHIRLALLDGMGGHQYGREVTERIVEGLADLPACSEQGELDEALDALHHQVREAFASATKAPGSTLTLLEISPGRDALLYHVGDSRMYAVTAEEAQCLTVDHAPPTRYFMQGLIDATEWHRQTHEEDRSALSQAFGMGSALNSLTLLEPNLVALGAENLPPELASLADRRALALAPDRLYLLASDGLWAYPEPHSFIRRWPEILCGRDHARLDYLLDDLFEAHILGSTDLADIDNSTAIFFRLSSKTA